MADSLTTRPQRRPEPARRVSQVWRRSGTFAAALVFGVCCATTRAALLELKETAAISTAVVRLGDVAAIRDADEAHVARLADVTLCPTPAPGKSRTIDFEAIRNRLASQGFDLSGLEFSGNSLITVSGARAADGVSTESGAAVA